MLHSVIHKKGYKHLQSDLHLLLPEIPWIFKANVILALWPWRVYQFLKERRTWMMQCWSAVTQQKKVDMAKLNWTLNYHISVDFILDLKIGDKIIRQIYNIRQIYKLRALLFTEQRTHLTNVRRLPKLDKKLVWRFNLLLSVCNQEEQSL